MNLSVNLIEDAEKRHGGSLPLLFFLRSVGLSIPVLVILFIAHIAISLAMYKTQLIRTEAQIKDKEDQLALSAEIMKQQKIYRDMLAQMNGWRSLRIDCNKQLDSLRLNVPLEVQLTSLNLSQSLTFTNNAPTAHHLILLKGKTSGANPEANLTRFRQNIVKDPALTDLLSEVIVPEGAFIEDTSEGAHPSDRLFELNCAFKPRVYK